MNLSFKIFSSKNARNLKIQKRGLGDTIFISNSTVTATTTSTTDGDDDNNYN